MIKGCWVENINPRSINSRTPRKRVHFPCWTGLGPNPFEMHSGSGNGRPKLLLKSLFILFWVESVKCAMKQHHIVVVGCNDIVWIICSYLLISAATSIGGCETSRSKSRQDQRLGDEQAQGIGGTEPTSQGSECPLQWANGIASQTAGATPSHGRLCL